MRQHLNFDHYPGDSPDPAKTRYRVDALLQPCQVDGWVIESPHFGRNALRRGLVEVEFPTWKHPVQLPFARFLQERFFVTMRAELGMDVRDPLDPDDSWLPTTGPRKAT